MPLTNPFARLDSADVTLILAVRGGVPHIAYWGPRLSDATDGAMLDLLGARGEAPASPASDIVPALTPMPGQGYVGRPGIAAHREGRDWATWATVERIDTRDRTITIHSVDASGGLTIDHHFMLGEAGVLVASTTVTNTGDTDLQLDHLAAPVLPVPAQAKRILGFEGRWSGEFQLGETRRTLGTWLRENRRGRTSHDAFPGLILAAEHTDEAAGLAYGFHLGWSGNHRIAVETLADPRALVSMEALLLPGEVRLPPGARYQSPPLHASVTTHGLSALSAMFHRHVRARPEHARLRAKPRPVHYNCWEAIYFDHDPKTLMALAERAAAVGAERFVLDDGWFLGRRDDTAGLGDWQVDPAVYPEGLAPLIDRVRALGMEFGLWVEPEMVNPDSALFRAHPDWVLATPPAPPVPYRNQLVLDFGRAEVRDHLFGCIDALLRDHAIGYLKWDMNSDLPQPGGADGRAGANAHVLGVYAVLDRLRACHPHVEIESCASGGGRADYGILARTDRIWTSDSNDALDRLAIQRGFSHVFPAEVMGAHVGPEICHITGRRLSMELRVQTAMFGHMGVELDLRGVDDAQFATLAAGIAAHKAHRALLHSGHLVRLDASEGITAFGIVADDGREALFSYTCVREQRGYHPEPWRLAGLRPDTAYRLSLAWPAALPPRAALAATLADAPVVTGEALMTVGLQPPRLHPQSGFVLHLTAM